MIYLFFPRHHWALTKMSECDPYSSSIERHGRPREGPQWILIPVTSVCLSLGIGPRDVYQVKPQPSEQAHNERRRLWREGQPQEGAGRDQSNTAMEDLDSCQNQESQRKILHRDFHESMARQQPDYTSGHWDYKGTNSLCLSLHASDILIDSHLFLDLEQPTKAW